MAKDDPNIFPCYTYLIGTSNTDLSLFVAIERTIPKVTRPITVLTAEELDALDELDATFAELAAD